MRPDLMTIPAIAHELGIAYQTAHRWIAEKTVIPSQKLGEKLIVVDRRDFEKFAADYRAGKYERWSR